MRVKLIGMRRIPRPPVALKSNAGAEDVLLDFATQDGSYTFCLKAPIALVGNARINDELILRLTLAKTGDDPIQEESNTGSEEADQ